LDTLCENLPPPSMTNPNEPEYYYKASDGFQQVDVILNISDSKKLKLFGQRSTFETHQSTSIQTDKKPTTCLFTVITQYEFVLSNPRVD
jgi:hypothetical protein